MDSSDAEEQLQSMEVAWQGAADGEEEEEAGQGEGGSGQPQQRAAPVTAGQQRRAGAAAGDGGSSGGASGASSELTNASAQVQGRGAVSIGEAMDTVESGHGPGGSTDGGSSVQRQPIVVDADRASFERLLLMPGQEEGWQGGRARRERVGAGGGA